MIARLKHLWATRRVPFLIFFGSLAVALWFAGNFVAEVIYWNDPRHRNQALKPKTVADILGIDHPFPARMRMSDIVEASGRSYDELTEALRAEATIEKAARKARGDE